MADPAVTFQVEIERDDDQWAQNQHQQGLPDLARKFHIMFGLLKLLTIAHFQSMYIICEVIYLISLVKVTEPSSPNRIYGYLYVIFGTLGFELLLWTNISLVTWLVINFCLLMFAPASFGLLMRGFNWFLLLVQPLDDMPLSEVRFDFEAA